MRLQEFTVSDLQESIDKDRGVGCVPGEVCRTVVTPGPRDNRSENRAREHGRVLRRVMQHLRQGAFDYQGAEGHGAEALELADEPLPAGAERAVEVGQALALDGDEALETEEGVVASAD